MSRRNGSEGTFAARVAIETGVQATTIAWVTAFILALAALVLMPRAAGAALIKWNNSAGGSWSTAANWAPAVVPGASDDVAIDLAGTYTITAAGPIAIRSLTIGAASGSQMLFGSGTISVSAASGPTPGTQTGIVASATLTGTGAFSVPVGATLTLRTCTVSQPLTNNGTLVLTGTGNVNGGFTSGAGSLLRIAGVGSVGSSIQTFANGFTNNGTIEMTSSGGAYSSLFTVTSGTLVNAPGRTIDVQAGSGGTRTLTLQLGN